MITTKKVHEVLPWADSVSHRHGEVTIRWRFFYSGASSDSVAERVVADLKAAGIPVVVTDKGRRDKPFRGGKGVAQNSHFFVKFCEILA